MFEKSCCLASLLLLFIIAGPTTAAVAGDLAVTADTVEVELPEVQVRATRMTQPYDEMPFSYAVHQATPQEVALAPRLSMRDAIGQLPGLQIDNRGHFALDERISVRGIGQRAPFGTRGINVILDGVPMTMPDGQAMLEAVDPSLIRNAELLRGPASLFWGNASGGALLLSTEKFPAELGLQGRASVGSFGNRQIRAEAYSPIGDGSFQAFGSHTEQDGYRDYSWGYRSRAGGHGHIPLGDATDLRISGAFVDQETEHPGTLNWEQVQERDRQARDDFQANQAGKRSTQGQLGLHLTHEMNLGALTVAGFGLTRTLENPLPFAFIDLNRTASGARVGLENTTGPVHWSVGMDASGQWDDRRNFNTVDGQPGDDLTLDQFETVADAAAFGSARVRLTDQLHVQGGLRADGVWFHADDRLPRVGDDQSGSRDFLAWSPAAGVSYDFGETRAFLNYRTAFETPTTTELVNRPDMEGGFNPDLQPQTVRGVEAGWRGVAIPHLLSFDATVYRLFVEDQLVSFRTEEGGDRDFFRNAGLTTHDGFELAASLFPFRGVEAELVYSFSHFIYQDDELEGNRVPGISPHNVYASVTGNWDMVWLRARADANSAAYVNDENDIERPGYIRMDLQAGISAISVPGATVAPFVSIDNVWDEQYIGSVVVNDDFGRYFEPAAGRSFTIGVNVEI